MARRGEKLSEHILWIAKDVFLEMGFERASMDVVASRAETSKRTLYAHFKSKKKLFLAVIELVRGLFLSRLRMPGDYSEKPVDALVMFCGRYLEILLYEGSIRMIRVSMAETERFPEQAAEYLKNTVPADAEFAHGQRPARRGFRRHTPGESAARPASPGTSRNSCICRSNSRKRIRGDPR